MASPFSSSGIVSNSSTANMDAWINEVFTGLVTNCGIRQLPAAMDSGQFANPVSGVAVPAINTAAGYWMFTFTDALSAGPLSTVAALVAGTGYNGGASGTFTGVTLSGGAGSGGKATVVLGAAGVVSSITITTPGTGYLLGDQLTVTSANMVSAGAAAGGGSSSSAYVNALTSAASPVLMKLECGTGTATTTADLWLTVGTSWTSNGVVGAANNGAVTLRTNLISSPQISSTITYNSRFLYNNTLGACGMVFKETGGTSGGSQAFLYIFRSNDSSGNPTGAMLHVLTQNNATAQTNNSTNGVYDAMMSYTANTVKNPPLNTWHSLPSAFPASLTSLLTGGVTYAFPAYSVAPAISYSAYCAVVSSNDIPVDNTVSVALVGTTPLTFLCVDPGNTATGFAAIATGAPGLLMVWQ